ELVGPQGAVERVAVVGLVVELPVGGADRFRPLLDVRVDPAVPVAVVRVEASPPVLGRTARIEPAVHARAFDRERAAADLEEVITHAVGRTEDLRIDGRDGWRGMVRPVW